MGGLMAIGFGVPCPKPQPRLRDRIAYKQQAEQKARDFKAAVWKRDGGKCRATGVALSKSGTDPHTVGEVDHTLLRSTDPDKVYDPTNGVLLSKYLNRLRKVVCRLAPQFHRFDYDGPADRGQKQTFVWRNDEGAITKQRIG